MAGLAAANKLYTAAVSNGALELCVVEAGNRIGGRINTSEFGGDRIEMGATWIHGIGGSPVYRIAREINSLESDQPWECMDGSVDDKNAETVAEGGHRINSSILDPISNLFKKLMDSAAGSSPNGVSESNLSLGSFLRNGLEAYWASDCVDDEEEMQGFGGWCRKSLEDAIFAMFENTQRTYTSAGELGSLDFVAEREYRMFPGEEITIAKGYMSIVESLASVLPPGLVRLGQKVVRIEWNPNGGENGNSTNMPVKLHFVDGSVMFADHVVVTVSLGVLKHGIKHDDDEESGGLFDPPLPSFKTEAISRLGFGVVNKLFLKIDPNTTKNFPNLQMVFHKTSRPKIDNHHHHQQQQPPWWMRRTASLFPIYSGSSVVLAWFAGKEALELESLEDKEIIDGVSATISNFLPNLLKPQKSPKEVCNGHTKGAEIVKVLKSQWGSDPLFFGSYSYVAVGSSGDDLDTMAEPLPANLHNASPSSSSSPRQLQILFAGEATHRTHYSTTHGAYFSGLREANRLLQHYHCTDGGV